MHANIRRRDLVKQGKETLRKVKELANTYETKEIADILGITVGHTRLLKRKLGMNKLLLKKMDTPEFKKINDEYKQLNKLPDLMKYEELANYFRVSQETIKRWVRKGKIKKISLGHQVRFDKGEILRIIKNKKI